MTAYIVRLIKDRELVGIVWAGTTRGLWRAIDEHCDPFACEYAPLPDGGIFWNSGAPAIPIDDQCDEDDESDNCCLIPDAETSERLGASIYGHEKLNWKQFDNRRSIFEWIGLSPKEIQ